MFDVAGFLESVMNRRRKNVTVQGVFEEGIRDNIPSAIV